MNKPSYYINIPASVRYDDSIPPVAKLIFGEIGALCGMRGHCFATNKHLGELYGLDARTVSRYIKKLKEGGYIEISRSDDTQQRIITVAKGVTEISTPTTTTSTPTTSECLGVDNQVPRGRQPRQPGINTTYNTTNNTTVADATSVMDHFNITLNKKLRLTDQRKRIISNRLKDHTIDELKTAITNFSKDTWADRMKYCDIVYAIGIRSGVDNLDRWLNTTVKPASTPGGLDYL